MFFRYNLWHLPLDVSMPVVIQGSVNFRRPEILIVTSGATLSITLISSVWNLLKLVLQSSIFRIPFQSVSFSLCFIKSILSFVNFLLLYIKGVLSTNLVCFSNVNVGR